MTAFKRAAMVGAIAITISATAALLGSPATAAPASIGTCASGTDCLTLAYNSYLEGGWFLTNSDIPNLAGYKFGGGPDGAQGMGQYVKNNAASAQYNDPQGTLGIAVIYYNSNYAGPCDGLPDGARAYKLINTYNEDASVKFYNQLEWPRQCYTW